MVSIDGLVLDVHHLVALGLLAPERRPDHLLEVERRPAQLAGVPAGVLALGRVGRVQQRGLQGLLGPESNQGGIKIVTKLV